MRIAIETHGCKLNQADSEALARRFRELGHQVVCPEETAEVYILNTCTVTHTADAKARQALRSAHRKNPRALIVATGCLAQRDPASLRAIPGVSLVVGNTQKEALPFLVLNQVGEAQASPCSTGAPPTVLPLLGRTRAFIKIQEGCNQVCAYCIVPRVRGRERSVPLENLVREVERREAEGYQEVVLTGTQLGSYGHEWGGRLGDLLEALLARTRIPRIRVSSLQPQELSDRLLELWQDARLCPHFHIPLQSGSDAVLRRMRRRYTRRAYLEAVERIRRCLPHSAITTDIIVGFPGETEGDFQQTVDLCRQVGFARMHLFPYSPRPGTSAYHLPDPVPPAVKRRRLALLAEVARQQAKAFQQASVGTVRPVLWEERKPFNGQALWFGLTDTYLRVCTYSALSLGNRITPARLVAVQGDMVWARVEDATVGASP
ncbi:Threonylcarbamoyladenosine tRNA methylthiotransferase MtaB [bacterium HR23]|nr:Threonylcarbamoyladenosine tRNA methylthiotransferase MtaB [bacterium HR23]